MKRQTNLHLMHGLRDLNLLTTLRHLLETCSVTATAERLRLSQPAVSRALGRLRVGLQDPLFVRSRGRLIPTARAKALQSDLEGLLVRLDDLLATGAGFEPLTSRRTFVVATSDYSAAVLLPPLLRAFATEAPFVTVRVVPTAPAAEEALSAGTWDTYWAPPRAMSQAVVWTKLFEESFEFVLREGHPAAGKPLTLERFLSISQLALSPEGLPGNNPLDARLARLGVARRVVAHLPSFALVPALLAGSDLGAVLPKRIAAQMAPSWGLVRRPLPFTAQGFVLSQAWHERHRHDAGHSWFRKRVAALAR